MKRNTFNKTDRQDLHRLGELMNARYEIQSTDQLEASDVKFCRHVMYWHQHYVTKGWNLPSWAQMPDFQNWLNAFSASYRFYTSIQNSMDKMMSINKCAGCGNPTSSRSCDNCDYYQ